MSLFDSVSLMEEGEDSLLRPGPLFYRLPATERRRMASTFLDFFHRMHVAHQAESSAAQAAERENAQAFAPVSLRDRIAWSALGSDIEEGLAVWRRELQLAQRQGAGRSPADKRHGWRASALAGGPGCGAGFISPTPEDALPYSPETRR